jgi:hypothetical protein
VRILSGFGAVLFGYLAIIPAELIGATLDSACAGGICETAFAAELLLTTVYALCLVALGGTAVLLAHHATTGAQRSIDLVPRSLAASAGAVAVTLFVLFASADPDAAGVAAVIGGVTFAALQVTKRMA